MGFHDRQRHDRLARPAGEVVDVQRNPARQQHHLCRQRRHLLPRPQPEQREPQVGEHADALDPAFGADELGGGAHVRIARLVAREAQRPVGLHRARQIARAAVEVGPRAVGALLRADPGGGALGLGGRPHAEKLPQEYVLGVHRDVRLQLSAPPAALVLQTEEVLAGPRQCRLSPAGGLHCRLRHARNLGDFQCGRHPRRHPRPQPSHQINSRSPGGPSRRASRSTRAPTGARA